MTLPEDTLRIWMQDAKGYMHRYWSHPHYDDIVAEAYLTMWEAISRAPEGTVRDLHGYAMRAAWNGAQAYLSSPRNEQRTYNVFKKKACVPSLSLEAVRERHYPEWSPAQTTCPDFVPPLIERIDAEAELARMSPKRRAAIWLCAYQGLTRDEARAELGWSRDKIDKILCGVSRDAIPYAHPGGWRGTVEQMNRRRDEKGRLRGRDRLAR